MVTFKMHCPWCGQKVEVDDEWIGLAVECPVCQKEFIVRKNDSAAMPQLKIVNNDRNNSAKSFQNPKITLDKKIGVVSGVVFGLILGFILGFGVSALLLPGQNEEVTNDNSTGEVQIAKETPVAKKETVAKAAPVANDNSTVEVQIVKEPAVAKADARALGTSMKGAFGAGVNARTAGVRNEKLVSALAQLIADVHNSGAYNIYISAFRAWCEKNNKYPDDPDVFAEFKGIAGMSTSPRELAVKLGVSESSILSKGSDYLTMKLSRMHDATDYLAYARVDEVLEFAVRELDSDAKKAFKNAGVNLKTHNMSQIEEKLKEAGYSVADIGKYIQAAYNTYSTVGGILGLDADAVMVVISNRRVN